MKKKKKSDIHSKKAGIREIDFDDVLDLDEEPDAGADDVNEDDYITDEYEEDSLYDEEDDISAWKNDVKHLVNPKMIFGIAAVGVLVFAGIVTMFSFSVKKAKEEREAAVVSLNPPQAIEESSMDTDTAPVTEKPVTAEQTPPQELPVSPDPSDSPAEIQTEISVGALDDEQDPQGSAASGREESGAEVTVSKAVSENETANTTMGIDVSKYQGTINWAEVKASGVDFAMIRVGYRAKSTGEIFEDPTARYNLQEAQAAGIMTGAYFFSSAVTQEEARAEARFTKDIIAKYRITYPVAYNCEDFQSPDSRQYGLDASARTNLACAFLDEISAGGYTPMFYASKGELEGNAQWNTDILSAKYKIWVAQYPDQPYPDTKTSTYSASHDMWQYTSQGIVSGIARKTDVNIAYFGYSQEAAAKDETPAETVSANPEVGILFTEVNETVTAKQETNLRSEPSTLNDTSIVAKLVHGDTATRTGIGHNGWSRVLYNGQTLYAVSNYLTTDMEDTGQQAPPQGPVYTPVSEQVTAKMETNLRTEPSTASDDTIVGLLRNGEVLTRTAVGDNGWSQLDYNGTTVYAVSSYLTSVQ